MSSKSIIGVVIAAVVVVGGYFLYSSMSNSKSIVSSEQATNTTGGNSASTGSPQGKKMAFDVFMKQGGSYQCTVHQSVQGTDSTGIVYLDNGMVSGKFNTAVQGINVDSNFIMKDGYSYTWTSMMPGKGFKVAVTAAASDGSAGTSGTNSWDASQIGDYDCQPWTADASKFALPSATVFTEIKK